MVRDRSPYWRARVERMQGCRAGEPPRSVLTFNTGGGAAVSLRHVDVLWADFIRAVGELQERHEDGERLAQVVEMWVGSMSTEQIGERLARPVSQRQAERLLNAAYRWLCDPIAGGFILAGMSPDVVDKHLKGVYVVS